VLRAVVFDVDFTLALPGPNLGADGYRALGVRYGLDLDPTRYEDARRGAFDTFERHPELEHDEETWVLFTQRVIEGMGGRGDTYACAAEMTHAWEHADHFELYDDVLPTLADLRSRGLLLGLLSNTARDLQRLVDHHSLEVDAVLTSRVHGKTKPHEAIFRRMLELLGVAADESAMVGDSPDDDIDGALAIGMQAVLIDREDRHPEVVPRLRDLRGLQVALGLV
jgi:putative hydrolase of the HAD superfamily